MKYFLFVSLFILWAKIYSFAQCPQPGLKIQSASCDSVRNLKVASINCSQIKVSWQGNKGQTYIVNATGINAADNTSYNANVSSYNCNNKGACQATISVKENSVINWSVQSSCTQNSGTLHSYAMKGQQVNIPVCAVSKIKVYPNPTTGKLSVEYKGDVTPVTKFSVYNTSGKEVYSIAGDAVARSGTAYTLDLHSLTNGLYFLKIINGDEVSQVKFVLLKN